MIIEKDARRFIMKGIEIEQEMKSYEIMEKMKGRIVIRSPNYDKLRKKFIEICCRINSVANSAGKGRDDLTIDILNAAEDISRKISNYKSRAVRKLAEQIKISFLNVRMLFRKYSENIEIVDPQLKNNADLSDGMLAFEKAWEKGKDFFLDQNTCRMFISFSQLIEGLSEKYLEIREKIESVDSEIFMIIPCITILRSLDNEDRSIYSLYYPELSPENTSQEIFNSLKNLYFSMKKRNDGYDVYNALEQAIIQTETEKIDLAGLNITKQEIDKLIHEIKRVAIMLQRSKPAEWNSLMETAMGII